MVRGDMNLRLFIFKTLALSTILHICLNLFMWMISFFRRAFEWVGGYLRKSSAQKRMHPKKYCGFLPALPQVVPFLIKFHISMIKVGLIHRFLGGRHLPRSSAEMFFFILCTRLGRRGWESTSIHLAPKSLGLGWGEVDLSLPKFWRIS